MPGYMTLGPSTTSQVERNGKKAVRIWFWNTESLSSVDAGESYKYLGIQKKGNGKLGWGKKKRSSSQQVCRAAEENLEKSILQTQQGTIDQHASS